jgi:peptide-methionine (S)-S-oxide reductase
MTSVGPDRPVQTDARAKPARPEGGAASGASVESKATFGAGCFWGVEAAFRQVEGVTGTRVGYSGGTLENPSYEDVCSHTTGHAEVVEVTYDPERVSYDDLLDVFWAKHDPTQLNRQGWDIGDQYRSVVFFHHDEQREAALRSKEREQPRHRRQIVTQIEPAQTFYEAEDYHQQYLEKRGRATCTPALSRAAG